MAKVLGDKLDIVKRSYLANMTQHQGFPVLREMMEEACQKATYEVIKLDPNKDESDASYNAKLARLQLVARATNDFCASVLMSIDRVKQTSLSDTQEETKGINALLERVQKSQHENQ